MDNVTHTLVGLAVGEAAAQIADADSRTRRRFWLISAIANNFPDLDILYHSSNGPKISYLLEHRGFTHTLLMAVPQALLIWLVFRFVDRKSDRRAWNWFFALALLGICTHIAFDSLNSYGVHPFWPWSDRWFYADTLFIVEPWLWLSLVPMLYLASERPLAHLAFGGVFLFATGILWGAPYVPVPVALWDTLWGVVLFALSARLGASGRAAIGIGAAAIVVACFAAVSHHCRVAIAASAARVDPKVRLDDIILTPMPSNLMCWNAITVEHGASAYRLRRGTFAPFPRWFAVGRCPRFRADGTVAPLEPVGGIWDPRFKWEGEFRGQLADVSAERAVDCTFAALLRFARAPYFFDGQSGKVGGDLRYDFSREIGFAGFRLPGWRCPKDLPPWAEPRRDWFQ